MILGVILAGGASSRMGRDKALVEVAGVPMVRRVGAALEQVVDRLCVAGRRDPIAEYEAIPDPVAGRPGPLAGLAAATKRSFRHDGPEAVTATVAVDHPFVRSETVRQLLALFEGRAVVPVDAGVRQVTCGIYPVTWWTAARDELEAGGSLQTLLDRMPHREVGPPEWAAWGEDGRSWFSVDDEAALAAGLALFGSAFE